MLNKKEKMIMKYQNALLVVRDLARSKEFYKKYLDMKVEVDFGANVTLTGGLTLQTLETWREFIGGLPVEFEGNAGELYFEEDDYDSFLEKLETLGGVQYVHPPLEHAWGQRVVRFYDPDGHMIEVGENMSAVVKRFAADGMDIPQIAKRMGVAEKYVLEWLGIEG
jgi:catechol 2,3-dioxygenase-like lactoylglutathione lyase family enzyme